MSQTASVTIIGGGLAGCEAAWQLLKRGFHVNLYEMKPVRFSPAHKSPHLAELVCSNSFRAAQVENAVGLLKEEMRLLASLIMEAADHTAIPAGRALAVDRMAFSRRIEEKLGEHKDLLSLVREEFTTVPEDGPVIIASGPLTSDALAQEILRLTDHEYLYFYDAVSPIIDADSIDYAKVFWASRYAEGEGDYLNCPLNREEYESFCNALINGTEVPLHEFEKPRFFEGCLPIEIMAKRGIQTLAHGPMKPVGLTDPKTGEQPHAVVQLRRENSTGNLFNMVGFQTKLTWPEQRRIFRMIPGLENSEFVRYGSIHRNTFINAPALLTPALTLKGHEHIYFAGQISGVEGYIESAAMGLMAGLSVAAALSQRDFIPPPMTTAHGALVSHITTAAKSGFQPMNVNFGLFPPPGKKIPAKLRGKFYAERALGDLRSWMDGFSK
ncbi:MAG: methylenetetrahydrofolate--tRNA-(uracil(54)-C(5))-methyltransferase (FADH(2)-oxidizing) TrmFO [Syntrophales bacterium]|nr:methylenetetrahydrofolate--tRNA-(uracil(54)-C(5))-methyltransferase (FADH(2)-oxidizing) TrmFO [Syntrophales bacterium]